MSPSDISLQARLRAGDASALERLLRERWAALVAYAEAILHEREPAEDVAQEVFVRLWERREEWVAEGSLTALLYTMTRNLALDGRRRIRRQVPLRDETPELRVQAGPAEQTEGAELAAAVHAALQALPPRRREVFVLARFHGLSHRHIAEVLALSPQTVANHLSLALADLRVVLAKFLPDTGRRRNSGR